MTGGDRNNPYHNPDCHHILPNKIKLDFAHSHIHIKYICFHQTLKWHLKYLCTVNNKKTGFNQNTTILNLNIF